MCPWKKDHYFWWRGYVFKNSAFLVILLFFQICYRIHSQLNPIYTDTDLYTLTFGNFTLERSIKDTDFFFFLQYSGKKWINFSEKILIDFDLSEVIRFSFWNNSVCSRIFSWLRPLGFKDRLSGGQPLCSIKEKGLIRNFRACKDRLLSASERPIPNSFLSFRVLCSSIPHCDMFQKISGGRIDEQQNSRYDRFPSGLNKASITRKPRFHVASAALARNTAKICGRKDSLRKKWIVFTRDILLIYGVHRWFYIGSLHSIMQNCASKFLAARRAGEQRYMQLCLLRLLIYTKQSFLTLQSFNGVYCAKHKMPWTAHTYFVSLWFSFLLFLEDETNRPGWANIQSNLGRSGSTTSFSDTISARTLDRSKTPNTPALSRACCL